MKLPPLCEDGRFDSSGVKMANMWDFDAILRAADGWADVHNADVFLCPNLIASPNQAFGRAYQAKCVQSRPDVLLGLRDYFDRVISSGEAAADRRCG